MPASMVRTKRDEKRWDQAKARAAEEGREGDWPYIVGIFQRMSGVKKGAHIPGMLLLPESYGRRVWGLTKGAGHKYLRRVPIPGKTTKSGKPRYRYYYDVGHGGGVANHEHMVEGASFKHGSGHYHIEKREGGPRFGQFHLRHDVTGEKKVVEAQDLAAMIRSEHGSAIKAASDKVLSDWKDAHENGAAEKQLDAIRKRAKSLNVSLPWHAKDKRSSGGLVGVTFPKTKKKTIRLHMTDGSDKSVAADVSGVWALDRSKKGQFAIHHVPSGNKVLSGDEREIIPLFAMLAHHAPDAAHDTPMGQVPPESELKKLKKIVDDSRKLSDREAWGFTSDVLDREKREKQDTTDAKFKSTIDAVKPVTPKPFKSDIKVLGKDAAFKAAEGVATKDETRPSLLAVHYDGEGHAVATDGHRLIIVPTNHREKETVGTNPKHGGDFPKWQMITDMAKDNHQTAEFDAESLQSALKAAGAALNKHGKSKTNIVRLEDGKISTSVRTPDGTEEHDFNPGHSGEIPLIGVNYKYLTDALKGVKGTVKVTSKDHMSPIVVERPDGIKHIIMPMRI